MGADSYATLVRKKKDSGPHEENYPKVEAADSGGEAGAGTTQGLIRGGHVYRNGDEHLLTDMGREALAQPGVYPGVAHLLSDVDGGPRTYGRVWTIAR